MVNLFIMIIQLLLDTMIFTDFPSQMQSDYMDGHSKICI